MLDLLDSQNLPHPRQRLSRRNPSLFNEFLRKIETKGRGRGFGLDEQITILSPAGKAFLSLLYESADRGRAELCKTAVARSRIRTDDDIRMTFASQGNGRDVAGIAEIDEGLPTDFDR